QGYFQKFIGNDRRLKFSKVLKDNNIEYIPHTMIKEVVTQEGKVSGAMGFHVPSGTVMTFHAKSVIMAMGGGSYKPTGYPVGGNTFDGEYIGYKLGLPIIGKEFDDFHLTCSYAAGNAFENNNWTYLENIWLCGGDITPETAKGYAIGKGRGLVLGRVNSVMKPLAVSDGSKVEDLTNVEPSRRGATLSGIASDIRTGKNNDPMPKGDVYGAAVGMSSHLSAGIFCGIDDTTGYTGIPGLYVSGDGICGSAAGGAAYANGVGFTSNFCSTQGWITGKEAAGYASGTMISRISSENKKKYSDEILAPMQKEGGLSPAWARDLLQTYMAPYWVHIAKDETSLKSTLTQIEYMRDNVLPQLSASNTHELRLCHEMESKILCAEMKLRASMERKESRGYHYRTDYPARDDKNFLCYMGVQKGDNGEMKISKIEVKDEWKGDVNAPYTARYLWQFPGDPNEKKSSRG
ncbi:MAG: FAD-binding protein, partial [Spirochaetales bacterium]|nr:FAD-binding protein [Spirochaetales bacterium]